MIDFKTTPDLPCLDPARRHDFILLFDVENGNPNGDPDMDNQPRLDPETSHGLVTDVCLKRKVRNFVALTQPDEQPNRIYVQDKGVYLNKFHGDAHKAVGIPDSQAKNPDRPKRDEARAWMCANFFDVRMFGAVMSTKINAGQVRGPFQLTFGRSEDAILPIDVTISRVALTDESEKDRQAREQVETEDTGDKERFGRSGTFGRKWIVPYGLYRAHGFYSPAFGKQTGVTADDLALFWQALEMMWEQDRSAARGMMTCRGLYVFTHATPLGDAPAHKLFEHLDVHRKDGVEVPRRFADYAVSPPSASAMPSGITLSPLVEG
jgi:CRISPR-associated protein Csd2